MSDSLEKILASLLDEVEVKATSLPEQLPEELKDLAKREILFWLFDKLVNSVRIQKKTGWENSDLLFVSDAAGNVWQFEAPLGRFIKGDENWERTSEADPSTFVSANKV